jgi:hypothetical protein
VANAGLLADIFTLSGYGPDVYRFLRTAATGTHVEGELPTEFSGVRRRGLRLV